MGEAGARRWTEQARPVRTRRPRTTRGTSERGGTGRVLVQQWISADGMVAGPDGESDVVDAVTDCPSDRHDAVLLEHVDDVLLGTGTPLLDPAGPGVRLALREAETWPGGALPVRYAVPGA